MVIRLAFETLIRPAVVEQITDAVYRVFENRGCGKYDHPDLWIHKGNDVVSQFSVFLLCPASLISLPSGPAQWLFQKPPTESKFIAASKNSMILN